jgi:rhodanese-related sulfurtransferase
MNWIQLVLIAAVVALFVVLRRVGLISAGAARQHLKNGAMIVDVRTDNEHASGHLPRSLHLPLDRIENLLPKRVRDKETVLLLYCQSGMRSRIARHKAQALGYTQAFNLGSLARAGRIVSEK